MNKSVVEAARKANKMNGNVCHFGFESSVFTFSKSKKSGGNHKCQLDYRFSLLSEWKRCFANNFFFRFLFFVKQVDHTKDEVRLLYVKSIKTFIIPTIQPYFWAFISFPFLFSICQLVVAAFVRFAEKATEHVTTIDIWLCSIFIRFQFRMISLCYFRCEVEKWSIESTDFDAKICRMKTSFVVWIALFQTNGIIKERVASWISIILSFANFKSNLYQRRKIDSIFWIFICSICSNDVRFNWISNRNNLSNGTKWLSKFIRRTHFSITSIIHLRKWKKKKINSENLCSKNSFVRAQAFFSVSSSFFRSLFIFAAENYCRDPKNQQ